MYFIVGGVCTLSEVMEQVTLQFIVQTKVKKKKRFVTPI